MPQKGQEDKDRRFSENLWHEYSFSGMMSTVGRLRGFRGLLEDSLIISFIIVTITPPAVRAI